MAQILIFAGNFAPTNWLYCQGQLMSIAQYSALYALIGTTYGGDGESTFALPDLQGRTPVGYGQGPGVSDYELGQKTGNTSVSLSISNLPPHTHAGKLTVSVSTGNGSTNQPNNNIIAHTTVPAYATADKGTGAMGGVSAAMDAAGSSMPVDTLQPYLAMGFVICVEGIFPSRS